MDVSEPRPRRRGYFLTVTEPFDLEFAEDEAAEGITIRLRILRPGLRRHAAAARRAGFRRTRSGRQPQPARRPSPPATFARRAPNPPVK